MGPAKAKSKYAWWSASFNCNSLSEATLIDTLNITCYGDIWMIISFYQYDIDPRFLWVTCFRRYSRDAGQLPSQPHSPISILNVPVVPLFIFTQYNLFQLRTNQNSRKLLLYFLFCTGPKWSMLLVMRNMESAPRAFLSGPLTCRWKPSFLTLMITGWYNCPEWRMTLETYRYTKCYGYKEPYYEKICCQHNYITAWCRSALHKKHIWIG